MLCDFFRIFAFSSNFATLSLTSMLMPTMLFLYNTASRSVQPIKPIVPGKIGMYCCGPTVYQRAHIGNLRAYVMEDILRRVLESVEGYEVKHVMNITDVGHLVGDEDEGEDKIEKSSREQGKDAWHIAREYEKLFRADIAMLNVLEPSAMPRATEHIAEQIELVKALEEKGYTYRTSDGIYFDTSKMSSYGRLSGQRLEDKQGGARVEMNQEKRNATDFALWKFSPADQQRQMEWDSPWGKGFPGWHIECSAMSRKELGQPFDIHCGGVDHIPVHHENEIAQSECAYGVPYVQHWTHVEFLTVEGQKMSKSIGNVFNLDDLRGGGIDARALRLFFLGAHYRSKQNFTWEAVKGAQSAFIRLERIVRTWAKPTNGIALLEEKFRNALLDDLNTPSALAVMWEIAESSYDDGAKAASMIFIDRVLGLGLADVISRPLLVPADVQALAERRLKARQAKDWVESDRVRDEMAALGWVVQDTKDGYTIERL